MLSMEPETEAMFADAFRRIVTMDASGNLDAFLDFLEERKIPCCVIGGQAVNA